MSVQLQVVLGQYETSSSFIFEGTVYGYEHAGKVNIFQRKNTVLEGALDRVRVNLYQDNQLIRDTYTNSRGDFKIHIEIGRYYKLELYKKGYSKEILFIDLTTLPILKNTKGYRFSEAEFVLNSYKTGKDEWKGLPIGKIFFDKDLEEFEFAINKERIVKKGVFNKKEELDNAAELMVNCIEANKENMSSGYQFIDVKENEAKKKRKKRKRKKRAELPSDTVQVDTVIMSPFSPSAQKLKLRSEVDFKALDADAIAGIEEEIANAKEQLAMSRQFSLTREDSMLVMEREALILAVEKQLVQAKAMIVSQRNELLFRNRTLYLFIALVIVLVGLSYVLYNANRAKRRNNAALNKTNKQITDSINYAKTIQASFLLDMPTVNNFLPGTFIFFRPKDIVSGDFYWFADVEGKQVVVSADCTGHGVPGAFLSLVGNTLLNQIVLEKKVLDAARILELLHLGVFTSLRQDQEDIQSSDGMDMSICIVDKSLNQVQCAGAFNPIYLVKNDALSVVDPDLQSVGGKSLRPGNDKVRRFTNKTLDIEPGMILYMFSDGYMDQFGGDMKKKFNMKNFKALLMRIANRKPEEQCIILEEELIKWQGSNDQVDDILVLGIKF